MSKRTGLSMLAIGVALATAANGQVYVEGVNDTLPMEPGWTASGGNEIAYRWTAQNSFDLHLIEWHTGTVSQAITRVRSDSGGVPGAILREAAYSTAGVGWAGQPFATPLVIAAGQSYFVSFTSVVNDYPDFLAQGGVHLTYLWAPNGSTNWNGPFDWAGHRMIKFYAPDEPCVGDLNDDGDVDLSDLALLLSDFGSTCPGACPGEVDGDGDVDLSDLALLLAEFGTTCP